MKSNTKDRLKILITLGVFLICGFMIFNLIFSNKATGVIMPCILVEESNTERIENLKKNHDNYVYKVEEDNNTYLKVFNYDFQEKNIVNLM